MTVINRKRSGEVIRLPSKKLPPIKNLPTKKALSYTICKKLVAQITGIKKNKVKTWVGMAGLMGIETKDRHAAKITLEEYLIENYDIDKLIVRKEKKPRKYKTFRGKRTEDFYDSKAWKELRYKVIKECGAKCNCCGRTPKEHKITIHIDHIKPRSKYPELELKKDNLQALCEDCNLGKGNLDETDWRK